MARWHSLELLGASLKRRKLSVHDRHTKIWLLIIFVSQLLRRVSCHDVLLLWLADGLRFIIIEVAGSVLFVLLFV